MKNLFLSVVLLLTVSFAFAANDVEKVSTVNLEESFELNSSIEAVDYILEVKMNKSSEKAEVGWACCTVTRNGGSATHLTLHKLSLILLICQKRIMKGRFYSKIKNQKMCLATMIF